MGWKPTCSEVHRLLSESMDRKLSRIERMRVWVHLLVCRACTGFNRQMDLIRRAMRQIGPGRDDERH
jgi:predicted anti-sigma-YlaC factor YlaD